MGVRSSEGGAKNVRSEPGLAWALGAQLASQPGFQWTGKLPAVLTYTVGSPSALVHGDFSSQYTNPVMYLCVYI